MSIVPEPEFAPKDIEQLNPAYHKKAHVWIDAPPGAGPGKVCKVCGARMHVVGKDSPCGGVDHHSGGRVTKSSYDPYEDF